jgi:lysozyme
MRPSPWLYTFLKTKESYRGAAFLPTPNDVPTIAWGHTRGVKMGDVCTIAQGEVWLREDSEEAEATLDCYVKVPLTQWQYDALCSLVYNIGRNNFVHGGPGGGPSHILMYLNEGNYVAASAEFPRWNKQHGVVLNGLTLRRAAEQQRFETP